MRITRLFLIIPLFSVMISCQNDFSDSQHHHLNQSHDYKDGDSLDGLSNMLDSSLRGNIKPHLDIRDIWQKPGLVISLMGNLDNKVVADIGAGPYGYFSLRIAAQQDVKKVIAIDIDQEALNFIDEAADAFLSAEDRERLETRLATPADPRLEAGEADVVMIVNTVIYFEDRIQYFRNLHKGLTKGGKLVIVDYKKKQTPIGPPVSTRVALGQLEQELMEAGYLLLPSDDKTLEFQYIITAVHQE